MRPRLKHRELALLAAVTVAVLALGWIIASDLRQSADDATRLYQHLARSLDLVDELQFRTQEVRRTLLYALHTSDANLQLQYAEQSRAADREVQRLLESASHRISDRSALERLDMVGRAWREYLGVRDEVTGLILEGSLKEGVSRDERQGTARFNRVRDAIAALKQNFQSDASVQADAAKAHADLATARLTVLVLSALIAAAVGISLVSRRAALEALLRIEAHKGSILEAVQDPIISTDAAGFIIELNEAAERAFGVSRAVALGERIEEVILPPARRKRLLPDLSPGQGAAPVSCPRIETLGRRRDGTEFPMELAAVTHSVGGDRIWTIHLSDLTERRHAEEELRHAKDVAENADRAKSEFLATMSHELRTPLVGVIGAAELLQKAELPQTQRDLVGMLRSSASALLGLVSGILDYSRIEAGLVDLNPVPFSLRACIEDALDPVTEPAARKGLDLGYVIEPLVPATVVADPDRVRQVLLNLLSNAVKFSDKGEVAVHVSAQPSGPDTMAVHVRVRDTGRGIPAHLRPKLFQRFSQIHGATGAHDDGAGLGLAISEHLSRMLGGSLTLESELDHGSTFTFVFSARAWDAEQSRELPSGALTGLRVLALAAPGIVSDHLRSLLREAGATVDVANEETAAAGLLTDRRWDAVIADADALAGALHALAVVALGDTAEARRRLIVVTRLQAISARPGRPAGRLIVKPIRARTLCEAVAVAAGVPQLDTPRPFVQVIAVAPEQRSLSILLVEDSDANRRVVEMMINELGLRADGAASGREAIEAASRRHYDVILMDVQMPDVDGLEATRQIRAAEQGPSARIIALTANVMEGDETRCREAGMDGYLSKPLRLSSLAAVLLPLAGSEVRFH